MIDGAVVGGVVAALVGQVLGVVFYGGLWWTVRRSLGSPRPGLWFVGSLGVRAAVVLGGVYLVGHAHWPRLLACGLGFLTVRLLVIVLGPPAFDPAGDLPASRHRSRAPAFDRPGELPGLTRE